MPAIFWLQCLALASSSRAWPAPTKLFLRVLRVFVVNKIDKQANLLNQILGYQADLGNFKLAQ